MQETVSLEKISVRKTQEKTEIKIETKNSKVVFTSLEFMGGVPRTCIILVQIVFILYRCG